MIFSNPFADTSEIAPTPTTFFRASIATDINTPIGGSRWQPGQDYHDTGTLGVAETGVRHLGKNQIGFGGWEYRANPDAFTPPDQKPVTGMFMTAERTLFNEGNEKIIGFARAGNAPGDTELTRNGWGAGFTMKGFVPDRPDGEFRFGVAGGTNTSISLANGEHTLQTRFELMYQDKITDNLTIQPGLNFTVNPGSDPAATSGLVAGMRIHYVFK